MRKNLYKGDDSGELPIKAHEFIKREMKTGAGNFIFAKIHTHTKKRTSVHWRFSLIGSLLRGKRLVCVLSTSL